MECTRLSTRSIPSAHDRFGIVDQFGWQNIQAVRVGATFEPYRRLSVTAQGLDFWADSPLDSVYNTSGGAIVTNKVKQRHAYRRRGSMPTPGTN